MDQGGSHTEGRGLPVPKAAPKQEVMQDEHAPTRGAEETHIPQPVSVTPQPTLLLDSNSLSRVHASAFNRVLQKELTIP